MRTHLAAGIALAFAVVGFGSARAGADPTLYVLAPGSEFEQGCFPPCECPSLAAQPLRGIFWLTPAGSDPLFDHFDLSRIVWRVKIGGEDVAITGSGRYRRGGEFALMHQLELDISIGGAKPQHFDSGLLPGGSEFPTIAITVSLNGGYCFDTVLRISAKAVAGCG